LIKIQKEDLIEKVKLNQDISKSVIVDEVNEERRAKCGPFCGNRG